MLSGSSKESLCVHMCTCRNTLVQRTRAHITQDSFSHEHLAPHAHRHRHRHTHTRARTYAHTHTHSKIHTPSRTHSLAHTPHTDGMLTKYCNKHTVIIEYENLLPKFLIKFVKLLSLYKPNPCQHSRWCGYIHVYIFRRCVRVCIKIFTCIYPEDIHMYIPSGYKLPQDMHMYIRINMHRHISTRTCRISVYLYILKPEQSV